MQTDHSKVNLDALADQAHDKVMAQQARTAALNAGTTHAASTGATKVMTGVLVVVACGALAMQAPRFTQPFLVPDATSVTVAEVDVAAVGEFVELFRLAKGELPNSLDEVNMPAGLRAFTNKAGITYKKTSPNDFSLVYVMPQWRVEFDGNTGKTAVSEVSR